MHFRMLLATLGLGTLLSVQCYASPSWSPYSQPEINTIYNLLFCDNLALYAVKGGQPSTYWQTALFSTPGDPETIIKIADDPVEESRVRLLAYNWLRQHNKAVSKYKLLGVVIEVPLDGGLDVLAAYADGTVRYINRSGKLAAFEGGPPEISESAHALLAAASGVLQRIGPWDKDRLPPPKAGNVRLTFLVSDGLYFGEGGFSTMQRDPMAGPIIADATQLLQLVVRAGMAH